MREIGVVPAGQQAAANARCAAIAGNPADARTFTVGLSPDGRQPATHYWACGEFSDAVLATVDAEGGGGWERWDCEAYEPDALLAQWGLRRMRAPWEEP